MLKGWGNLGEPGHEIATTDLEHETVGARLTRGLGRSYGDSSLPAHESDKVVASPLSNRLIRWDAATGVVRAEAGFALAELNRLFMPQGWFTPVSPGTKFVTLGGMVACDVHGKNHHREGCFGEHVRALKIRLASGDVVECSPTREVDLFDATIGGMGLLGHILEVEVGLHRIPSQWIWMETDPVGGIDAFLDALGTAAPAWPMTMGWIDCLAKGSSMGRGALMAGRWAEAHEAPSQAPRTPRELTMPVTLPNWALNPLTARLFNEGVFRFYGLQRGQKIVAPDPFFYPLDMILHWNRAYGSRGFTQYQCVVPRRAGAPAVRAFMELLTKLGGASPLCVIKDCGPEGRGVLSFPLEGTSIAVDMAVGADTQRIVDALNAFVIETGGRIYLTKDRFTRAADFARMEPRLDRFRAARAKWDPQHRLRSAQSRRIFGDP